MPKRILKIFAATVVSAALVIAVEVLLALRRDYFVDGPAEPIRFAAGDAGLPLLRLVVLGDSTSVGVGTVPQNSFPVVLAKGLANERRVELTVVGRSGARARDLAGQVRDALALDPDMALICIGANDATHVTPAKAVAADVGAALDKLVDSGATVVVAGPPDMGTSRAFAEPLRSMSGWRGRVVSRAIEAEVASRSITFIPLAELTGVQFDTHPDRYYSRDLFHPGSAGYELWAEKMLPYVAAAVKRE